MSDDNKPEHPAPWRWAKPDYPTEERAANALELLDANDNIVLSSQGDDWSWVEVDSPVARELIRLAPEMEALLRELRDAIVDEMAARAVRAKSESELKERHYSDLSIIDHESSKHIKEQWTSQERIRAGATGLPAKISALLATLDAARKSPG